MENKTKKKNTKLLGKALLVVPSAILSYAHPVLTLYEEQGIVLMEGISSVF